MELESPLNIKRVSSVLLAMSSLESEDNKMSPIAANRSTQIRSPYTPNLYLTNSVGCKHQQQLIYPAESKIKILNEGWILTSGKIKLISKQGKTFEAEEGYIWFISPQLKNQIKQVETIGNVALKRLNHNMTIVQNLQNYYKQTKDILSKCPYFSSWNFKSIMDIVCCSSNLKLEANKKIYDAGENPNYLYILKSGQIEVIRNCTLTNRLFESYEMQLEEIIRTQNETRYKITAGNCFGLDGVFIKQGLGRIYTVITRTPCEISKIPVELINLIYQLFDPKAQDKFLNKAKQYTTESNSVYRYNPGGIINKDSVRKREFVKMVNEYENKIKMKSVAFKIPKLQKSLKIQKPKNPFLQVQEHKQFYKVLHKRNHSNYTSVVPEIKNTKSYIGFLKERISEKQILKEHSNYKKKVEEEILKASKMRRQTKSTDCFRIKAYSLEKRLREQNVNPE